LGCWDMEVVQNHMFERVASDLVSG
jgi:hypothetical protein